MLRYVGNLSGPKCGGEVPHEAREGREGDLSLSEGERRIRQFCRDVDTKSYLQGCSKKIEERREISVSSGSLPMIQIIGGQKKKL